jgi:hypothetical protein
LSGGGSGRRQVGGPSPAIACCSAPDGLSSVVTDERIEEITGPARPDQACQALVDGEQRQRPDNVTALILKIDSITSGSSCAAGLIKPGSAELKALYRDQCSASSSFIKPLLL